MYLPCETRQQARRQPGQSVLLLQRQGHSPGGRDQPSGSPCIPSGHDRERRSNALKQLAHAKYRAEQVGHDPDVLRRDAPTGASHRYQEMLHAALGEDPCLDPVGRADEERADVRPLLHERFGDGECGVEVTARASARKDHHRALLMRHDSILPRSPERSRGGRPARAASREGWSARTKRGAARARSVG